MVIRRVKNVLALAVLSYLTEKPMHAYELQQTLTARDAARTFRLSYGSLYNVVQQLAAAGFIAEHAIERSGHRPERIVYTLTAAGQVEMHDWLHDLLSEPQPDHSAFVAALSLISALHPDEAVVCLRQRLAARQAEQQRAEESLRRTLAEGVHPLFLVEDDYRVRALAAETGFLAELIDRIERPDDGWAAEWARFHDHDPLRGEDSQ